MSEDRNWASLQHSVLTLLVFNDEYCKLVRNSLPLSVWGADQGVSALAKSVYEFIDVYKKCPGTTHVYELAFALSLPKEVKNNLIEMLSALDDNQSSVNVEFTVSRLERFYRKITWKSAIEKSIGLIDNDELDKVEDLLHTQLRRRLEVFDRGTSLLEALCRKMAVDRVQQERDRILLGIPALDDRGLVPTRKQLMVLGAGAKGGKSFWLVHVAKRGLLQGKRVLYLTLELDKDLVSERIIQAMYALTKRKVHSPDLTRVTITENGFLREEAPIPECINDDATMERIYKRLERDRFINNNLLVKEFPMGMLTMAELRAFLDNLEMQDGFVPDVIIIDYADLMFIEGDDYRLGVGKIYKNLRGLAGERNVAIVTASQLNRAAVSAKRATGANVAEDYSKIATADLFLTYNQTDNEKMIKLARLYVANARTEEGGFEIAITQDYATSQFVITSQEMTSVWRDRYDDLMKKLSGEVEKSVSKTAGAK